MTANHHHRPPYSPWAEIDNEGDLDLLVANWGAVPVLYLNDGHGGFSRARTSAFESGVARLKVRLVGTAANRRGLGARILFRTAAGGMQMREVSGLTSWHSQDDLMQHFGLGESAVDSELRWGGERENNRCAGRHGP